MFSLKEDKNAFFYFVHISSRKKENTFNFQGIRVMYTTILIGLPQPMTSQRN